MGLANSAPAGQERETVQAEGGSDLQELKVPWNRLDGGPGSPASSSAVAPVDREQLTPNQALLYAAECGDLQEIREQLKAGASPNVPDLGPLVTKGKEATDTIYQGTVITGDFPLHRAAANGHVEAVNLLFLSMARIDNRDRLGSVALHRAVSHGQLAVVEELLKPQYGADIFARNKMGNTPLHIAAYCGNYEITKVLLEAGAHRGKDKHNKIGFTPLDYCRKAAIRELIESYRARGMEDADGYLEVPLASPQSGSTTSGSMSLDAGSSSEPDRKDGREDLKEVTIFLGDSVPMSP